MNENGRMASGKATTQNPYTAFQQMLFKHVKEAIEPKDSDGHQGSRPDGSDGHNHHNHHRPGGYNERNRIDYTHPIPDHYDGYNEHRPSHSEDSYYNYHRMIKNPHPKVYSDPRPIYNEMPYLERTPVIYDPSLDDYNNDGLMYNRRPPYRSSIFPLFVIVLAMEIGNSSISLAPPPHEAHIRVARQCSVRS